MISSRRLLVLVVAVSLLAGMTLAQQGPKKDVGVKVPLPDAPVPMDKPGPPQKDKVTTLSIDVDLVDVDVVVTDQSGNPISGLTKANFKVFDDNIEQNVTNFSPSDAPLTVALLLEFGDTFGYMFDDVVQPAAGFISSLRPEQRASSAAAHKPCRCR